MPSNHFVQYKILKFYILAIHKILPYYYYRIYILILNVHINIKVWNH
jgi:hypothetical protein